MKGTGILKGLFCLVTASVFLTGSANAAEKIRPLTGKEQLGKLLFFDPKLSVPEGQSCASCHAPEAGFTGADSAINQGGSVYEGATKGRFGNRKPPAASYGGDSPVLHFDRKEKVWVGGMFWDGRATGKKLKDPLAEQAQGPFLNPLEQNIPDEKTLCLMVRTADYAQLFEEVWGKGTLDCEKDAAVVYEQIGRSISAYERSAEVDPFTSKFDYWLEKKAALSAKEKKGMKLFQTKGKCSECHPISGGKKGKKPLFTDFTYDNLGIPKNPSNPFYSMPVQWNPEGKNYVDYGLGGYLRETGYKPGEYEPEMGKHKVPTLRNVGRRPNSDLVKAYGHNGYFKSLKEIVHFYNTRDVLGKCEKTPDPNPGKNCWPQSEVSVNLNTDELGNLKLTEEEEDSLVAFMETLTDGYTPDSKKGASGK